MLKKKEKETDSTWRLTRLEVHSKRSALSPFLSLFSCLVNVCCNYFSLMWLMCFILRCPFVDSRKSKAHTFKLRHTRWRLVVECFPRREDLSPEEQKQSLVLLCPNYIVFVFSCTCSSHSTFEAIMRYVLVVLNIFLGLFYLVHFCWWFFNFLYFLGYLVAL